MTFVRAAAAGSSRTAASSRAGFDGVNRDDYLGTEPGPPICPLRMSRRVFSYREGKKIMEGVIFIGIPGSGKSSFFIERFFRTHVRISLDLLNTRHRERRLLEFCLTTEQPFVVDNTNPARRDRVPYISAAKAKRFKTTGYYFQSKVENCLRPNVRRPADERVPDVAILSSAKMLERPALDEGFNQLFYVSLGEDGFVVEGWRDEVR